MNSERFAAITGRYPHLRISVIGDFCLDRYLEIDPSIAETSIETGLPVYNVVNVRSQPGAAGTIVNNLVALGIGAIDAVGFCGEDGEGYELEKSLRVRQGVQLDHFFRTNLRRTFVYCKPLLVRPGHPPRELNRFDTKNWSPTPDEVQRTLQAHVADVGREADALILMDQVSQPETGTATVRVCNETHAALEKRPGLIVLADSRRGLGHFPPLGFKMNAAELLALTGASGLADVSKIKEEVSRLARKNCQPVFVTLADYGIVGALSAGVPEHIPSRPVHGPIDIVGAGDSVTANLSAALAAGANLSEAMELAMAAASIVIHQLGTTGTASVSQLAEFF